MKIERSKNPFLFFSKKEKEAIVAAIQEAEKRTSAEIRVHLERKAKPEILAQAQTEFERLGMTHTEERNGVLIFMGIYSKRFAIIGDQGIHRKVGEEFWQNIVQAMQSHFKEDRFADGIVEAIHKTGEALAEHFPHQPDDVNELSDDISYSF